MLTDYHKHKDYIIIASNKHKVVNSPQQLNVFNGNLGNVRASGCSLCK